MPVLTLEASQRENAWLRKQVAELSSQLAEALSRLSEVVSSNQALTAGMAKLNDRVGELLAAAQRKQRPPPVEKPPAPPPVVEAEAQRAFEARPQPPTKPEKRREAKKRPKPTGRKPVPEHLEVEKHELKPDVCDKCGSRELEVADVVEETKLHVVKEHQRRRVVRRTTCRCRDCGGRTTPRSLPAPYERSKITCDWLAWFVHDKFGRLTPLDRFGGGRDEIQFGRSR